MYNISKFFNALVLIIPKGLHFLLLLPSTYTTAQVDNYIKFKSRICATYVFKFCSDTTDRSKLISETFFLFINDNGSIFLNDKKYYNDSILTAPSTFSTFQESSVNPSELMNQITSKMKKNTYLYLIEKKYNKEEIKFIDQVGLANLFYLENYNQYKWSLENDVMKIENLKCYAAKMNFRGRNYSAWYSPEIPISDGPYKFGGLPGLITHIYDSLNEVEFKLIKIESYEKDVTIPMVSLPLMTTRLKMWELKIQHYLNPYIAVEASGPQIMVSDQQKAALIAGRKKMLEKNGNRIELE